ncbi:DNA primase catalytic subunit PriS [Methanosalsum natronophilum]|uniref:DNA primase catalytic subunit PriS n=1 Tax=Methanosalsum natronophilum TaxID=768733 RepID=UPI00216864F2|nr:DNA primase catalytic subunit PriS [Methanosalsum natronophilum]MCS3923107.1 DNA primase small subunit [Methanosalsum natronophilum]
MDSRTRSYIKKKFKSYYNNFPLYLPHDFKDREWGFILLDEAFNAFMRRHKSFGSEGELHEYLTSMIPAHCYYSVAYYKYPSAANMSDKGWSGSDLIFDLDADHLPNAPNNYSEMLDNVKVETLRLYDFLTKDFGFSEDDIQIIFSGGRGYHIHITEDNIKDLDSNQRREVIDYLSAKGLNLSHLFHHKRFVPELQKDGDDLDLNINSGWRKRLNAYIISYLQDSLDSSNALEVLTSHKGIGERKASMIIDLCKDKKELNKIKEGNFNSLFNIDKNLILSIAEQGIEKIRLNIDEPVTADIKRLIRLPGSLHGGSGLKVIPLTYSQLKDFNPLVDAIVFNETPTLINIQTEQKFELNGMKFDLDVGIQEIPEFAAIYLMCRGVAEHES